MFGGALIGTKIFIQDIIEMQELLPFVFLIVFGFAFMNIIIEMLLYKATNFSISTALFSSAHGGASDISIIASEMGADTPKVAILQLSRLIFIISFYPFLIQIFVDFFLK